MSDSISVNSPRLLALLCVSGFVVLIVVAVTVILVVVLTRRGRGAVTPAATQRTCPECGATLPPHSPEGLCARCLLRAGLGSSGSAPAEYKGPRTTPFPGLMTTPAPAELAPHFPQLEILELVGQGGMGAVYKARQVKLERFVALKVLPPEAGRDPAFAERFVREAQALARLSHPHIVAIYDFGETDSLYFLLMEFVDGLNLRQLLQAGQLQPKEALAIIPQICDALQYAHEEGIVHRDVKPENILLDSKGRVKIADFGLAKLLGRSQAEFALTGSQQVMGTLDYMAPEQRQRPLDTDHRADIYSLGVVFYEMLTGELPLGRFAPPSQKAPVDARLDEVVLRALETDPERRYQHASDVKTDVESIVGATAQPPGAAIVTGKPTAVERPQSGPRPGTPPAGPPKSRVWILVVLLVLILALPLCCVPLGGFVFLLGRFQLSPGQASQETDAATDATPEMIQEQPQSVPRVELVEAAREGALATVADRLRRMDNVNAQDSNWYSALMAAAENGHMPVVQTLLDHGANVNARDKAGKTALDYAKAAGHKDIVEALRAKGATGGS